MAIFSGEKAARLKESGVAAGSVRDNVCVGTLGPPTWYLFCLLHVRVGSPRFSGTAQHPHSLSYCGASFMGPWLRNVLGLML